MRFFFFGLLCLCVQHFILAQECMPSPEPPIFVENFGSGSNPGPALASGTTTYSYGSTQSGSYVVSNTTNLDPYFWHDGLDHTEGDTDGYMLIFNASEGPGIFYQQAFTDLCPNTNYIFAAYIANVVVPTGCIGVAIQPNIRFTVIDPSDGTTQASTSTGGIFYDSFLTWRDYNIRFRTGPEQTSALVQLSNNAPAGCGNDLAIDDISLHLCNVQREQSFDLCDLPGGSLVAGDNTYTEAGVYLDALPVPNSCNDTLITTTLTGTTRLLPTLRYSFCEGDSLEVDDRIFTESVSFVDTLPGTLPNCPQYQPYEIIAQSQLSFTQAITLCSGDSLQVGNNWYSNAGTYLDSLATVTGCDSVVITTINTGEIEVDLNPTTVEVELGQSVQLISSVSLSSSFTLSWLPQEGLSCVDCPNPILQPTYSGLYQLFATDISSGCVDSTAVQVTVKTCDKIYVPNAFSPDFDEVNDRLGLFTQDCFTRLVSWRIFDRWGGLVYEITDQVLSGNFIGWDGQVNGQPADQGTYGYQIVLERNNGSRKEMRGGVVLLR
jgi:gliding motility-associated-like protein